MKVGKSIRGAVYIHRSAWIEARQELSAAIVQLVDGLLETTEPEFNVLRIEPKTRRIGFLAYENFFEDPFPALNRSRLHLLSTGNVSERRHGVAGNPPILHRKELLLPIDDPRRPALAKLTQELESKGLFSEPTKIGYRKAWLERLRAAGLSISGDSIQVRGAIDECE